MSQPFRLSVAAPLYNEESVLPEFLRRTRAVLKDLEGGPHELVLVDDGSSDRTLALSWKPRQRVIQRSSCWRCRETLGTRLP